MEAQVRSQERPNEIFGGRIHIKIGVSPGTSASLVSTILSNAPKGNVKVTLVQALRLCTGRTAHRGSRGIALPFHDHGTRRAWRVSVTSRPLLTPRKEPVPIAQEAGWAPGTVWTGAENLATTRFDPRTVQSVASRYTDWATRPTHSLSLSSRSLLFSETQAGEDWECQNKGMLLEGRKKGVKVFTLYFQNIRNRNALFKSCLSSPACPSDKNTKKTKIIWRFARTLR